MLSVCGLIGLPLPENAAAHAVSASHITAKTETVRTVQLGGDVFGIKLFSDGVIVAALSEIYADGGLKCPAREAGIQPGDYILSVNGNNVETNAALSVVLSENETNTLTLRRGTETFTAQVTSVLCEGSYKAGMWVRDSAAGIGTVTFYTEDGKQETRTLVLHVTDPELLARTGGIVQGMSGCPILQNGKLVGAVTHVFVDDATRGYGIFAETMLENLNEN